MSRLTDHEDYAKDEEFAGFRSEEEVQLFGLLGMDDEVTAPVVELISDDEKRKELREAQEADPTIRDIKNWVKQGKEPPQGFPNKYFKDNFPLLVIREGMLCRKALVGSSMLPTLQTVIPPKLIPREHTIREYLVE